VDGILPSDSAPGNVMVSHCLSGQRLAVARRVVSLQAMTTAGTRRSRFWKACGPGLMWAASAIGVSHLVQSTRAGAMAGFGLAGVVLLALVLKYPFFDFGPRYAATTGLSLVEGYRRIGRWALWLYLFITLATSVIVQVAIVLFTSYVIRLAFGLPWSVVTVSTIVCAACGGLLAIGHFGLLDRVIKVVMAVLAASTLIAAGITLPRADFSTLALWPPLGAGSPVAFPFLLALAGWMPTAIDLSVWSSLWTLAKDHQSGERAELDMVLLDFRIGYIGTGLLAFAFLTLGAAVMYGSGTSFSPRGTEFSAQLVELYTGALGSWTAPIVFAAIVTTMFSTSLTVIDGFPRAIDRSIRTAFIDPRGTAGYAGTGRVYWTSLVTLAVMTVVILTVLPGTLTAMVDFATIVSFITAPVLGYLNLRAVTSEDVPSDQRPGAGLMLLARIGLAVLAGFAAAYLVWRIV
jgi:Mn2+/Fe2+ NRAMP family transporter